MLGRTIFMIAVGETSTDLNHKASFFHGAACRNLFNSSMLHVYLASALSIVVAVLSSATLVLPLPVALLVMTID